MDLVSSFIAASTIRLRLDFIAIASSHLTHALRGWDATSPRMATSVQVNQ